MCVFLQEFDNYATRHVWLIMERDVIGLSTSEWTRVMMQNRHVCMVTTATCRHYSTTPCPCRIMDCYCCHGLV